MQDVYQPQVDMSYYDNATGTALIYSLISGLVVGYMIVLYAFTMVTDSTSYQLEGSSFSPLQGVMFYSICISLAFVGLYWVILFSISVDIFVPKSKSSTRKALHFVIIAVVVLSWYFFGYPQEKSYAPDPKLTAKGKIHWRASISSCDWCVLCGGTGSQVLGGCLKTCADLEN